MEVDDERVEYAVKHTEILRPPKQRLSAFGMTNIYYYLLTEPAYTELVENVTETVIREGRVIAERPRIVTLFYTYKNEPKELTIVSDNLLSVVAKLNDEIDKRGDPLASIIKGADELWDVSLMKFIYEMTRGSLQDNLLQMGSRGLLDIDSSGVSTDARLRIEELFRQVSRGEIDPSELKAELDRWNVFEEYEDRFLAIFRKRR